MTTREQATALLMPLLDGAYQWGQPVSRRLKLWSEVDDGLKPCGFLTVHGETHTRQSPTLRKRQIKFLFYVYVNAKPLDPLTSGGTQLNTILEAVEASLAPTGADMLNGRNSTTLGNAVAHCFIDGSVILDPGDLDGDGIAIIPLSVLIP